MNFTKEEFNIMIDELLYKNPISFDMLCLIADRTLRSKVNYWCRSESCLRSRGYEDDIMQEIFLRLMKTTVTRFLLRKGVNGGVNNDPEGFEDWMFRVAQNLKTDFANKIRGIDFKTEDIDSTEAEQTVYYEYEDKTQEYIDGLKMAFCKVLSANVGIYKTLTWSALLIFMLDKDITKIKATELIVTEFENKTLNEMYNMILDMSKRIPWLEITEQQKEKILTALRKNREGDVSYGETKYKVFFMKQNGMVSGKNLSVIGSIVRTV